MATVHVPQKDGAIAINHNGTHVGRWNVDNHETQVAESNLKVFLSNVAGSKVVEAETVSSRKDK